jgi:hypothetical protein
MFSCWASKSTDRAKSRLLETCRRVFWSKATALDFPRAKDTWSKEASGDWLLNVVFESDRKTWFSLQLLGWNEAVVGWYLQLRI